MIKEEQILQALRQIEDPTTRKDIVSLGLVSNVKIHDGRVSLDIAYLATENPEHDSVKPLASKILQQLSGVKEIYVNRVAAKQPFRKMAARTEIPGVKHVILVGSGKGGVGKSTVAVNLAYALQMTGANVGLLDADIYGPSLPMMLGVQEKLRVTDDKKIIPAKAHGMSVMSMGFMAENDSPLIWRGPMAHKAVEQCLFDVSWGELDFLVVDLPPGTGDVHLTLAQTLDIAGAVIVSTPQDVGLTISRKTLRMFQTTNVKIFGIIENMSYHLCSHCGEREDIFGADTVQATAEELEIPFLGQLPLDTAIRKSADAGIPFVSNHASHAAGRTYTQIAQHIVQEVGTAEKAAVV